MYELTGHKFIMKSFEIENHSFISHMNGGFICKYCNLYNFEYFSRKNLIYDKNKIFPDCISNNEKLIKNIIE